MNEARKILRSAQNDINHMENKLEKMRHSCAHVVAAAIKELYPNAKFGVGPVVENGFFYDVDLDTTLSDADLKEIQKKTQYIINKGIAFERQEMPIDDAISLFASMNQDYKVSLLKDLKERGTTKMSEEELQDVGGSVETVSVYKTGDFTDLCRGPHVENSKEIGAFKLTKIAGAYWRGDANNPQLQRVYGVCFETKEELDAYFKMMEEAEKRDHRKLGHELELFAFNDEVGPGLPLWLPKGTIIVDALENLAKETEQRYGYKRVKSPHVAKEALYLRSGHLPYYAESMFPAMEMDNEKYYLKAMNCPHHHKIYDATPRSYRDLPLRLAEYGHCYRFEDSGALFGLMRVRSMNMNDAHIYCTEEQFEDEFKKVIEMYLYYFKIFGITKYQMRLSKHSKEGLGKKYVNEPELWIKTENQVRSALVNLGVPFVEVENEAAFYGPKIDVQVWSVIGREFTLATNQLDFAVPARFNLTYIDKDGQQKTPICIHRAPLSTHERMVGFLIEHYAGAFPVWLSPYQVHFVPVSEKHVEGARKLMEEFEAMGLRVSIDEADETVGKKIRNASKQKTPYVVVVGDKELAGEDWQIRVFGQEEQISMIKEEFVKKVLSEIAERKS